MAIKLMAEEENLSEFNRFLLNNRDFLIEKHEEYFSGPPAPTLGAVAVSALIDYIYDIFSFNKYRKDSKTHLKISASLARNINDFIRDNAARHALPFTSEMAIEALTYCIQHNDMFSVQYDVEKPPKLPTQPHEQPPSSLPASNANPQQPHPSRAEQERSAEESAGQEAKFITKTISSKSLNKAEDQIFVNITHLEAAIQSRHNAASASPAASAANEFDHHERIPLPLNPDILKRNARVAFLSFCKNQMELGGKQTFDRLEEEASRMTVGKLLVYAKAYDLLSPAISKEYLMARFRRVADGRRAIDFEQFYALLTELHIVDPQLLARLQLLDEALPRRLKFVKYPFYTQDQRPRELVPTRNFTNRLTAHSGKTPAQLREELASRRQDSLPQRLPMPLRSDPPRRLLAPRDLAAGRSRDFSVELSFIDKIVAPEEQDGKYLGEYEIEHLGRGLVDANSSLSLRRKDSIVRDIRRRIQQLELSERRPRH